MKAGDRKLPIASGALALALACSAAVAPAFSQPAISTEAKVNVLLAGQKLTPETLKSITGSDPTGHLYPVNVVAGDSVSSIVARQWGVSLTSRELDVLIGDLRKQSQNQPIASRSTNGLILRPGDVLVLPQTIGGQPQFGPLLLSDHAVNKLILASAAAPTPLPEFRTATNVQIAGLEPIERCGNRFPGFDLQKIITKLNLVRRSRGRAFDRVDVAVLDTGYNGSFATLKPYLAAPSAIAGRADRYNSESGGVNIPLNDGHDQSMVSVANPPSDHGTHISGLVLGGPDYVQLADTDAPNRPEIRLVPIVIETVDSSGGKSMQSSSVTAGLEYVRDRVPKIVNLSLEAKGIYGIFEPIQRASGFLYVVAAGNSQVTDAAGNKIKNYWTVDETNQNSWVEPGMLGGEKATNVISVAAAGSDGQRADFSAYGGRWVDLLAPGVCVDSFSRLDGTFAGSDRVGMSGTSQAAAVTSFAASLVAAVLGLDAWSPPLIKNRLLATAFIPSQTDMTSDQPDVLSLGNLHVERAISIYDDIVSEDLNGVRTDYFGTLDIPADARRTLWLCNSRFVQISTVHKIVPRRKPGVADNDPLPWTIYFASNQNNSSEWKWDKCAMHVQNFSKVRLRLSPTETKEFPIATVAEIIPRLKQP